MTATKRRKHNKRKPEASEVIGSIFYKQASAKAKEYAKNPKKAINVLSAALTKAARLEEKGKGLAGLKDNLTTLSRMLKAVIKKEYDEIPAASLAKALAAVVYFLFIADLIPDFIPVLGIMDDAAVIGWVVKSIKSDIDAFREWESARA